MTTPSFKHRPRPTAKRPIRLNRYEAGRCSGDGRRRVSELIDEDHRHQSDRYEDQDGKPEAAPVPPIVLGAVRHSSKATGAMASCLSVTSIGSFAETWSRSRR